MELIEKVKKALSDSGFPLEMKTAKTLKDHDWSVSVGSRYVDFETNVLREIDITANKEINGVLVHLFIECKKSDNKQLVLYAPDHNRDNIWLINPLRYFPRPNVDARGRKKNEKLTELWQSLPIYNYDIPVSKNIIFTKGEKIEQNNDSFFNSLNGIIKHSVITGSDGYIETGFRLMFFHILIYDGIIYQLSDSYDNEFDLEPVSYGQYKFQYRFKFNSSSQESVAVMDDLSMTSRLFGLSNIVEIMQPDYVQTYIKDIESALSLVSKKSYKGWGHSMSDFDMDKCK